MTKTYCGKDCELCTQKEQLGCWGCTDDKNRIQYRTCEIANCCWKMGHEQCGTCSIRGECDKLVKRDNMANYRIAQRDAEAMKKVDALRKAPFMAKWLMILFWVMIVSGIAGLLASERMESLLPGLYYIASAVSAVCGIVHALILLKLSCEEALYRKAAYCGFVATGIGLLGVIVTLLGDSNIANIGFGTFLLALIVVIGAAGSALFSDYYEYKAHANIVRDISEAMATKWNELWSYYVKILIALVVLLMFSSALGILGIIAALIVLILFVVVCIVKFVYVYETGKLFQGVAEHKE